MTVEVSYFSQLQFHYEDVGGYHEYVVSETEMDVPVFFHDVKNY